MHKSLIILGYSLLICIVSNAQEFRKSPKHPKGNPGKQEKALVFYNEAVQAYIDKDTISTKRSLQKAINTSLALTEAQLFMADVLYDEGIRDSALYYYISGIDFILDQEAHYYFRLFELGMELGEYEYVKHYVKYFKQIHGKSVEVGQYEKDYPYTVADFQQVENSIKMIYDYKSWQPDFREVPKEVASVTKSSKNKDDELIGQNVSNGAYLIGESPGGGDVVVSKKLKGKWSQPKKIEGLSLNGEWVGTPYFLEDKQLLYFSKMIDGQKDLFVAKYDIEKNTLGDVKPLSRINTKKDEVAPWFHLDTFYFSSNGYPGFGGKDIYSTPDNEEVGGIVFPTNPRCMKSEINTNHDEERIRINEKGRLEITRWNAPKNKRIEILFDPIVKEKGLYYEISTEI